MRPGSAPPGSTYELFLFYFSPNDAVALSLTYEATGEEVLSFNVTTDSHGYAAAGITSDAGDRTGVYTIEAVGEAGGYATKQIVFEDGLTAGNTPTRTGPPGGSATVTLDFFGTPFTMPRCGTAAFDAQAAQYVSVTNSAFQDVHQFWQRNTQRLGWEYGPAFMYETPPIRDCTSYVDNPDGPRYSDVVTDGAGHNVRINFDRIYVQPNWMFPVYEEWGPITVVFVIAHEMAHLAAYTANVHASRVGLEELQTDCWAGAYLRDGLARGFINGEIMPPINDLLTFIGDKFTVDAWMDGGPGETPIPIHATSYSRAIAVQEGLEGDLEACRF